MPGLTLALQPDSGAELLEVPSAAILWPCSDGTGPKLVPEGTQATFGVHLHPLALGKGGRAGKALRLGAAAPLSGQY